MSRGPALVTVGALFSLALILILPGCTKAQMHRPENIERAEDYSLAFIEFDDQGEPWAPSQLERTIQLIEDANRDGKRSVVVLFVHGWQNDASKREDRKKENNVEGFKRLLQTSIDVIRREGAWDDNTSLIGVYLAWRGRSSTVKPLKPLTFYSRRGAGQRVAGLATTEAILRVMSAAKKNPESSGIVIGHSFGGMIVERALMQALLNYTVTEQESIKPLADLVILVNPASQSMNAKSMLSIFERNRLKFFRVDEQGNRRESPLIVSATSTGDSATGSLYPMALGIKGWTKSFRKYQPSDCSIGASQKQFYKKTAGHNTVLHSHVVTAQPLDEEIDPTQPYEVDTSIDPETGAKRYSFVGGDHRFTIERPPWAQNTTPYWIMSVPPELIRDHSDIFTVNTIQLIRALLSMTGAMARDERSIIVREDGIRPMEIVAMPEGGVAFLELSRRFYGVGRHSWKPLALSCLPSEIPVELYVGAYYDGSRVYAIASGPEKRAENAKMRTGVLAFDFRYAGAEGVEWLEIQSKLRFNAAAGDAEKGKVYLAREDGLYVADMLKKKPKAELLSAFEEPLTISEMELFDEGEVLVAIDRSSSTLYVIDLQTENPLPVVLARDLGVMTEMDVLRDEELLILDTAGKRVVRLHCKRGAGCSDPETFIAIPEFQLPVSLAVDSDDGIWVGDLEAQSLFVFDSAGKLTHVLDSMAGLAE